MAGPRQIRRLRSRIDRREDGRRAIGRRDARCSSPCFASIDTQNAVSNREVFCGDHQRKLELVEPLRRSSTGRSGRGRTSAMKLIASGVTFSAAIVRSPSFSRSSSSTTMIIWPSRMASIAVLDGRERRLLASRASTAFTVGSAMSSPVSSTCAFGFALAGELGARTTYLPSMSHSRFTTFAGLARRRFVCSQRVRNDLHVEAPLVHAATVRLMPSTAIEPLRTM